MSSVFGPGRVAYPGLRAFGREEFDLFFGRESCVDEMVDTLGRTSFLAVLGTSGSGKSSLVRTGLLNALELGFLASAGSTWRIAELRPRGHPIRSLAVALLEVQGIAAPDEAEIEILSAFLRRGPRSLIEWASSGHLPPRANLMVLVDQFEELFRYQDYSGREEAEAFVGLLVTASREKVPIHVAITMRSEYLGACTLIDGLPEVINRGLYLTPRMSREECRQAIVGPAEVCGFRIEDRLVNKLLNDLTDFAPWEAGGGHDQQRRLGRRADQLPLMQHVLNLLWQKARARNETDIVLTLADYEAAGGLGGALDRHADEIAATVPPEHAHAIDPVFRSLVTGRTVEDAVRRPTRFGEIVELAGGDAEPVAAVVDAFRAQGVNFLTPGMPEAVHDDTIIDISHESLIRQWRRLSRCLDEEAHSADAWSQLLTRAERHAAGAGGLLTGLDLDNLVDWWKRTQPIPAWANRYGNSFAAAEKYLRDSQFAEADRKRQEEEEERKLLAAEQEANTGRRFKRLAGALAAALIVAFGAVGAAIYLWRESNAEALAALEAQAEADRQRQIAEAARTEAEEQRAIAEAEAAAAEAAREEADQQRAIAEAERAEAERARALAEAAEQAAIIARQEADQIIDSSIAYFAKSLGDEVAAIQGDPTRIADLGYAGGLLSRLAQDARAKIGAETDIDTSFVDALRPAFVVQDVLSASAIPSVAPTADGAATQWIDPPGARGAGVTADWSGQALRVTDGTGRVAARYGMPGGLWGNDSSTPIGIAPMPAAPPVAVIADATGSLWVGAGGTGDLVLVDGGDLSISRIDDVLAGPEGDVFVAFGVGRTGERGQSMFGSGLRVARLAHAGGGWRVADIYRMPRGPAPERAPLRLAGATATAMIAVADGAVVRTDLASGKSRPLDMPGIAVDAGTTADGRFLLVGGYRDAEACLGGGGRSGRLEPWPREAAAPQPAGLSVVAPGGPDIVVGPVPMLPDCLLLFDLDAGLPLWRGDSGAALVHTVRRAGDGAVEAIAGAAPDVRVLRIAPGHGTWRDEIVAFDAAAWGLGDFGGPYAAAAATGAALPPVLTEDEAAAIMRDGVLHAVADAGPGRVIAWRVGDDEVQVARTEAVEGSETGIEVLVYRSGQPGFAKDARIDGAGVACLPATGGDGCRFDAAAFSPDGNWLLVASGGDHAFVGRDGMLGEWEPNADGGADDAAVGGTLAFSALAALDAEGRSFVAAAAGGGGLRRIARLAVASPQPQSMGLEERLVRQARGVEQKAGEGSSVSEGAGGVSGGGAMTTAVTPLRLPGHVESDLAGFVTDPDRGVLYVWGPRIGLRAVRDGSDADTLVADVEFPGPIADAAVLGGGDVVAATVDGQLLVVPAERFRGTLAGGPSAILPALATGIGGAIDLWADNDRVLVSAGAASVDGAAADAVPPADATAGVARLRTLGFRLGADRRLVPSFVVPWDDIAGQLAGGELLSVEGGAVIHAGPKPIPDDTELLALAVMREEEPAREAPEFEIGFDMLRMRFVGEDGATLPVESCGWVLEVAVRMSGAIEENIGDRVKRACDEPAPTAPLVNAIFDDRVDERVGALLRLAPGSGLARDLLVSTLRQVAPKAADVVAAAGVSGRGAWEETLVAAAANGPPPAGGVAAGEPGVDPFAHWAVAMDEDRAGAAPVDLADALFHYAYAERLFDVAGLRAPAPVVKRRLALARILSDDVVYAVFDRVTRAPLDPVATGGLDGPLAETPLDAVGAWLAGIAGGDEQATAALRPLRGLVEEMAGDEAASGDPAAAAGHYRAALAVMLDAEESLSGHAGILGRIEEAEEIGAKLAALGDAAARADTAGAVLAMLDATLTVPVRRDIDPPELRAAMTGAFSDLAAAGKEGYDLSRFRKLGLRFLDFDWESRYQSIAQVGAERFYRELSAAESFASAALAGAAAADRTYWHALRGRLRFWLSTLEFENLDHDPTIFADWLDGALADYDAAGGPAQVSLWDATIIGGANSRKVELAATDAEALAYVEKASAAFRSAIDRDGTQEGYVGADGKPDDFLDFDQYRRRLAFDGYMLALERAIARLRDDPLLSGVGPQPGEPGYDRAALADVGYAVLGLASRREALREEAEVTGLIETSSNWSLDTVGDVNWGAPVAELGAQLRREAGLNGTPDLCERLAAHPFDVTRSAAAVDLESLDVEAVTRACTAGTARSQFHLARAFSKAGTAAQDELLRMLLPAAHERLPIAFNNISVLVSDAGGPGDDAQRLLTTFSQLSLIEAYPEIAALLKQYKKSARRAEVFEWLARKAATLGVPEAYIDVGEFTPDILTRALNYMIARDLFAQAGRKTEAAAVEAKLDAFDLAQSNIADLEAQAAARHEITPLVLDDALVTRIDDLLWDARSQATLR